MKSIIKFQNILFILCLLIITLFCDRDFAPIEPEKDEPTWWQAAIYHGFNPDTLLTGFEAAEATDHIFSTLIRRHDTLIAERYYYEDYNGDHPEEVVKHACSVTKSFLSALIGIAIDKGFIESVNKKMMDYFPEYTDRITDQRKFDIRIKHLLYMRAGFGDDSEHPEYWYPLENAILQPLAVNPDSWLYYNSGGCHILSAILTKATGMSTLEFANQYLFGSLEITCTNWSRAWDGINVGGLGLYLTPRDLLKLGQLYLNKGVYNGQQIVPSSWIDISVRNLQGVTWNVFPPGQERTGYGYLWWNGYLNQYWTYHANGYGGQLVFVIPDLDMVVVTTANANVDMDICINQIGESIEWIKRYVLGALEPAT
jgi:CubicO group peptidase (beta-lactamase class C family)